MKKTYGASGYMDWVARIPVGSSAVRVHFTGGALTAYGVTPAEFTTANTFFQKVIEDSAYFRDGRITLLRAFGEEPAVRQEEPAAAATTKVSVTCLQDAQEYLLEHFGISSSKVRTRTAAVSAGAANGIEFVGI